jgi:7-cyano-7-deazaguanine synthase
MLMRAVVLLSGGLDSSTCLAMAHAQGRELYALTVIYGQRHDAELSAARRVAQEYPLREHRFATVDLGSFGGSALTDAAIDVPKGAEPDANRIPVTYVPARNTVFLSMALAFAEARGAEEIWIGVNAVDYSGYPDCRPEFLEQFERLAQLATKVGVEGDAQIRVVAPLIQMRKSEIVGLDWPRLASMASMASMASVGFDWLRLASLGLQARARTRGLSPPSWPSPDGVARPQRAFGPFFGGRATPTGEGQDDGLRRPDLRWVRCAVWSSALLASCWWGGCSLARGRILSGYLLIRGMLCAAISLRNLGRSRNT